MYNLSRVDNIPEVHRFIDAAKNHALRTKTKHIYCPSIDCRNINIYEDTEIIISHLVCRGFMKDCLIWTKHGEGSSAPYKIGDPANIDVDGQTCLMKDFSFCMTHTKVNMLCQSYCWWFCWEKC